MCSLGCSKESSGANFTLTAHGCKVANLTSSMAENQKVERYSDSDFLFSFFYDTSAHSRDMPSPLRGFVHLNFYRVRVPAAPPTSNPQPGGPNHLSLSDASFKTCPAYPYQQLGFHRHSFRSN